MKYEKPSIELKQEELEDIICTSPSDNDDDWTVDDGSY